MNLLMKVNVVSKMMNFVVNICITMIEICIQNEDSHCGGMPSDAPAEEVAVVSLVSEAEQQKVQKSGLCVQNDGFRIKNGGFFAFKMMNFAVDEAPKVYSRKCLRRRLCCAG